MRLFVIDKVERERNIITIHDKAHFGRDKTLAQINDKYYWPDMYKEVCAYVSVNWRYIFFINERSFKICN